jgi:hypothetical protein
MERVCYVPDLVRTYLLNIGCIKRNSKEASFIILSLIWNLASLFEKQGHLEVKWQKSKHLHAGGVCT